MSVSPAVGIPPILEGITSTERAAITIGIVVAVIVFGIRMLPPVVSLMRRIFASILVTGPVRDRVDRIARWAPWWATERLLVKIFRVILGVVTVFAILLLWGQQDLVQYLLRGLSLSIPVLGQIGLTILLFSLAWVGVDILDSWLEEMTERSEQFTKHQEEITFRVLQIALFTAVGLGALTMWGVNLGGMLVGAGFLGIVVGIAAQQTLGSLLAGFVLMFSRPFEIGDWVKIGDEEGIVTDITVVNTRMENFDGELVVLPNDTVSNSTLINRSTKGRLRLRIEIGIDYESDPDHAQDVAVEALSDVDQLLSVPRPMAVTNNLGDSAIILELRFWIDKPSARRRARATSAAVRAVKRAFDEEGIKIPYPQRELMGREESGGFRVIEPGSIEEE